MRSPDGTGGTVDGVPFDTRVDLHGRSATGSLYATDTLSLGNTWHFTVSGRYNRTSIVNADRITPGGGPGSLDGSYVFGRFNPAAGVTYSPSRALNLYVGYSEGSRAPTSIELGCADPSQPCKLPNALAGDPPLQQVVARTWEAGVRGKLERGDQLERRVVPRGQSTATFSSSRRSRPVSDISRTSARRGGRGSRWTLNGRIGRLTLGGGYTFLDATYQSTETVDGSGNSVNDSALAGARDWTAPSRSSRAIGFRYSASIC